MSGEPMSAGDKCMLTLLLAGVAAVTFGISYSNYLDHQTRMAAMEHGYIQTVLPGTSTLAWVKAPSP